MYTIEYLAYYPLHSICTYRLTVIYLFRSKPIRVRAQRKFASSSSVASSPCGSVIYNRTVSSPSDWSTTDQSPASAVRKLLAGRRVNTDDFLTFLCLRGRTLNHSSFSTNISLCQLIYKCFTKYK